MSAAIVMTAVLVAAASADIQVTELFRAETPEELEAALADGYPMPWLAEILADTTIPEEDRYWLDCRVRAHMANNLHVFFDESGSRKEVEAEWIAAGERYWQEHVMVNPVGEDLGFGPHEGLPYFMGEPGVIMNLYGEQTGEFALTQDLIVMSRDGTIGVVKSGGVAVPDYVCLLYSDGSFREVRSGEISDYENVNVSQDGELVIACYTDPADRNGYLQAFDRYGNTLYITDMSTGDASDIPSGRATVRPVISSGNQYIAIPVSVPRAVVILDASSGELLKRISINFARSLGFSPDSDRMYLCDNEGIGILELEAARDSWRFEMSCPLDEGTIYKLSLCRERSLMGGSCIVRLPGISGTTIGSRPYDYFSILLHNGREVFRTDRSDLLLSPSGSLAVAFNAYFDTWNSGKPPACLTVLLIDGEG